METQFELILADNEQGDLVWSSAFHGGLFKREYYGSPMLNMGDVLKDLYCLSGDEIQIKSLLNTTDYYYVKNHYNEWYVGKFNGESFDFINDGGNFSTDLFRAKKIMFTTNSYLISVGIGEIPVNYLAYYLSAYNQGYELKRVDHVFKLPTERLYTQRELLNFVCWYSKMTEDKVERSLVRYHLEKLSTNE